MTFREFMAENGYELQTTFWSDFSIADRFGLSAIRDTFMLRSITFLLLPVWLRASENLILSMRTTG